MGLVPATPNHTPFIPLSATKVSYQDLQTGLSAQALRNIQRKAVVCWRERLGTFCSPLEQSCRILVDFGFRAILQMGPTAISCGQNTVRSRPAVDVSWPSTSKWTAMSRWKMIMMFWNLWWRKLGKQFLEEHAWVTAEFENYVYISVLGKCQRLFSWIIYYIYIIYNWFYVPISTR